MSRATVSAWVEGRVGKDGKRIPIFPDMDRLEALCLFFECLPSDMLEIRESKTPSGFVWRDFRDHQRGLGRPPRSAAAAELDEEVFG